MKKIRIRSVLLAAALALVSALLPVGRAWAVTVSPTALFIDSRSPTGTLTLYNSGNRAEEIEVTFAFGYPVSDATGTVNVVLADTAAAGEPSVVPWLRAFPRRLVLQPGQRQTLRVMVQAPASLAPGEYWGRVVVHSRGGQAPVEQTQGEVRMQLEVETAIATAVLFRKGEVGTGIAVRGAQAAPGEGGVEFTIDLERQGSAAFLGRVRMEALSGGRVVAEAEDAVAVYRTLRRRYILPLPAGTRTEGLTVRYLVDTDRPDLPSGTLKAAPVNGTAPVTARP